MISVLMSKLGIIKLFSGSGRSPGEGHGNLLQCSCLENPTGWGAWRATVRGVARSQTGLSGSHTHPPHKVGVKTIIELLLSHSFVSSFCDPMDHSPPGSSVHGILQARILEWAACPPPGDHPNSGGLTCLYYVDRQILYHWALREA